MLIFAIKAKMWYNKISVLMRIKNKGKYTYIQYIN